MNTQAQKIYDIISNYINGQEVSLCSTDGIPENEKAVILTMEDRNTGWKWKVYEGQVTKYPGGQTTCTMFGRVDGFESELGYFDLQEIIEATIQPSGFSSLFFNGRTMGA